MHGTQTGRSQRDRWPTDGRKADAAQLCPAVWKETAGLTICIKAIFFFLRRVVTTASLNCRGTDPDSSESFKILKVKDTNSSEYFFSKVVRMASSTHLLGAKSQISLKTNSCDTDSKLQSSPPTKACDTCVSTTSCESSSVRIDAIF